MGLEERFRTLAEWTPSGSRVARLGDLLPSSPSQLRSIEVELREDLGFVTRAGAKVRRDAVADSWWRVLDAAVDRWLPNCNDRSELLLVALAIVDLPWSTRTRAIRQKIEHRAFLRASLEEAETN